MKNNTERVFSIECEKDEVPMRFSRSVELLDKLIEMGASRTMLEQYGTSSFMLDGLMYNVTMLSANITIFDVNSNAVGRA